MQQHLHRTGVPVARILDLEGGAVRREAGAHLHRHAGEECAADCRGSGKDDLGPVLQDHLGKRIDIYVRLI